MFAILALFALTLERALFFVATFLITAVGLAGYIAHKINNLVQENWPKLEVASIRLIDYYFDRRIQIAKRQSELRRLRNVGHS